MEFSKRFLITLKDYGFKRIFLRIGYELRIKIDKILPERLSLFLIGYNYKQNQKWLNILNNLKCNNHNIEFVNDFYKSECINFKFINQEINFSLPIKSWNNKKWDRLWQFNLHYFDWIRECIDQYLEKNYINNKLRLTPIIINQWIDNNHIGKGDGWHSYTISIRLRNWIWALRVFPELANKKIISSIWKQLCWLSSHLENANGGNHYIENLCTLIIASLQFDNKKSKKIYSTNFNRLKEELRKQILIDGGHEERSASYHILLLDRLTELGCIVELLKKERPNWLVEKIMQMSSWLELIKLEKNNFPRFNDSPKDGCPDLDLVLNFSLSFIYSKSLYDKNTSGLRAKLLGNHTAPKIHIYKNPLIPKILMLEETGWTFIRPGNGWEIIFKHGLGCPKHLPGHVHSDLFTFDIYKNGNPYIVEAGTSTYQKNLIRNYERSGKSHNTLELSSRNYEKDLINYKIYEPIDIWDSFRAGRKANTFGSFSSIDHKDNYWVKSSHDGYKKIGVHYTRKIEFKLNTKKNLIICINDILLTSKQIPWRKWIHFSPTVEYHLFKKIIENIKMKNNSNFEIFQTSYADGFGKRENRNSICFYGMTKKGKNTLKTNLELNDLFSL